MNSSGVFSLTRGVLVGSQTPAGNCKLGTGGGVAKSIASSGLIEVKELEVKEEIFEEAFDDIEDRLMEGKVNSHAESRRAKKGYEIVKSRFLIAKLNHINQGIVNKLHD